MPKVDRIETFSPEIARLIAENNQLKQENGELRDYCLSLLDKERKLIKQIQLLKKDEKILDSALAEIAKYRNMVNSTLEKNALLKAELALLKTEALATSN